MKASIVAIVATLIAAASVMVSAQRGTITRVPVTERLQREPWPPRSVGGDTKIIGTVIDFRQVPVVNARVRLRDLTTGETTEETETNAEGEYVFDIENPSTYVVEMVMVEGYVLALSNAGAVARAETMQTVIQLPGRWDGTRAVVPNVVSDFVGISAQTTMTTLTATTLDLAVQSNVTPRDTGTFVSP